MINVCLIVGWLLLLLGFVVHPVMFVFSFFVFAVGILMEKDNG